MYLGLNSKGEVVEKSPNGERGFSMRKLQTEKKVERKPEPKKKKFKVVKRQRQAFYDQQTGSAYSEAVRYSNDLGHYRNLGGTIGDGLAPHCTPAEVISDKFAADFGLSGGFSGAGQVVGDALESLVRQVVTARAKIQAGDKAFFDRMRTKPPSAEKAAIIAKETARIRARDSGKLMSLYNTFSAGVVAAMDSVDKARAQKLKFLFDNPQSVLSKGQTFEKALAGEMGVIPVFVLVGVGTAVAGAATSYLVMAKPEIAVADKHIADLAAIAKDPNQPAESRAIATKALAESMTSISSAAKEAAGGVLGDTRKLANTLIMGAVVVGLIYAFVKIGIPLIKAKHLKGATV